MSYYHEIEFLKTADSEFVEKCRETCSALKEEADKNDTEIRCPTPYHRKIAHIVADSYGLWSVRVGKSVYAEYMCPRCYQGPMYYTTLWRGVKVSKRPVKKTKKNIRSTKGKKELDRCNYWRKERGLEPIKRTPRKTVDDMRMRHRIYPC